MKFFAVSLPVLLTGLISVVALLGWLLGHDVLAAWLPAIANMTFNTALSFLLIAVACAVLERGHRRLLAVWFSVAVGLFAALSLAQDVFGITLGIDRLLFDSRNSGLSSPYPGRMSPNTALGFVLTSVVVMALSAWDYWQRRAVLIHAMLLLLTMVGLLGIGMNVLFGDLPEGYTHFASISLLTATSFLLLAWSLMGLLRSKLGVVGAALWLYSMVQMMYRLKYPQKFALISLVFLLPIIYLMWGDIDEAREDVKQAKLQLEGTQHIQLTNRLMRVFAEHRGMTNVRLANRDDRLFRDAMQQKMVEIDRLLAENSEMDRVQSGQIAVPKGWSQILKNWDALKNQSLAQSERWRLHSEIIAVLVRHLGAIGEETGLSREQNLVLHQMIDSQLEVMPALLEGIGQLRGLGTALVAKGAQSESDELRIGVVLGGIAQQNRALKQTLKDVVVLPRMGDLMLLEEGFDTQIHRLIRDSQQAFSGQAHALKVVKKYFRQATEVIASGDRLNRAIMGYVDQQLHHRIEQQITIQYDIRFAGMMLLALLLLLFSAFYQSVVDTIRALSQSAEKMRKGEMEQLAPLAVSDELGEVVKAFNSIASELMRVSSRMRAVVDHAVIGIMTIDAVGHIHDFNPAAEAIFGYTADEVMGENVTMLMPESFREQHLSGLAHFVATGEGRVMNNTLFVTGLRKGGETFPMELLITSMQHDGAHSFIGMLRDVSEQQQLEVRLRHAQKMEAVGSLVGGVAHNFNNMLAGIVGKAYLAKRKAEGNTRVVQDIEAIETVAHKAKEMVTQLLTFAQKDFVHDQQQVSLVDLFSQVIATFKKTAPDGVAIVLTVDDQDLLARCDADKMRQLLVNLLDNACEAIEYSGDKRVLVRLERFIPDESFMERHATLQWGDQYACLTVEERGCGMDDVVKAKAFEPFYTTKDVGEGAGLGLSFVFGTVSSHQGVVEIESEVDQGTLIRIYLPLIG